MNLKKIVNSSNNNNSLHILKCIVLQVALYELLKALGINVDTIIGHSLGEIAVAYSQEVLTLEQTILTAFYATSVDEGKKGNTTNTAKTKNNFLFQI